MNFEHKTSSRIRPIVTMPIYGEAASGSPCYLSFVLLRCPNMVDVFAIHSTVPNRYPAMYNTSVATICPEYRKPLHNHISVSCKILSLIIH